MLRAAYNPVPFGPERSLPSWHDGRTDPTSLGYRLLHHLADEAEELREEQARAFAMRWLPTAPLDEPRWVWSCVFPFERFSELQVTVSADGVEISVERATDAWDFATAMVPVFWVDQTERMLLFRNLEVKEATLQSTTGTYAFPTEARGLVPDANVYWQGALTDPWQRVTADARSATGMALPVSGEITARYASEQRLENLVTGTALLERPGAGAYSLPLTRAAQANLFDGWGACLGLPRLPREDNATYRARLLAEAKGPPDPALPGVLRGVAAALGLVGWTTWDGVSPLNLASGLHLTDLLVVGVGNLFSIEEELRPEPRASVSDPVSGYFSSYQDWRDGWRVYVDGVPQQGATLSGNRITLAAPTSGLVVAQYSVARYTLTRNASGWITSLNPGQTLVSGQYDVLYVRDVNGHTAGLEEVQDALLITPAGLPTRLFLDLRERLQAESRTALGRAGWGLAYWFTELEEQPGTTQLALAWDAHLTDG